ELRIVRAEIADGPAEAVEAVIEGAENLLGTGADRVEPVALVEQDQAAAGHDEEQNEDSRLAECQRQHRLRLSRHTAGKARRARSPPHAARRTESEPLTGSAGATPARPRAPAGRGGAPPPRGRYPAPRRSAGRPRGRPASATPPANACRGPSAAPRRPPARCRAP